MKNNKVIKEFLSNFKEENPNCSIIFLYQAGSHLFNLNSKNSDLDFKGIYLPSPKDFFNKNKKELFKIIDYKTNKSNTKNSKDDVDFQLISLPKYLELLGQGDFNTMETLFVPDGKIIKDTLLMKEIREFRENLLIKNINSFLGFFKKEYRRYGVNINFHKYRLEFSNFLNSLPLNSGLRLQDHWDKIKEFGEKNPNSIKFFETKTGENVFHPTIEIGTRRFQWRCQIKYVIAQLKKSLDTAGSRQKNMAENGNEFKGLYHAQRLLFEAKELLLHNKISIPLSKENEDFLRSIKEGTIEQEILFNSLDDSFRELEELQFKIKSNEKEIQEVIQRMLFRLQGRMELFYLNDFSRCLKAGGS